MKSALCLALVACSLFAESKEISYRSTPQGELKLHVFLPPDWKASDKRPGIVFFFGGGFTNGTPQQFFTKAEYLASRGMVAISAEYRIRSKHQTLQDAAIEDCREAVRWTRVKAKELGLDPKRVAVSGGSSGGACAASTAYAEDKLSRPNALVLYNPSMESVRLSERLPNEPAARVAALADMLSPANHVHAGDAPSIMFFGTEDALLEGARKYLARSAAVGNRAELFTAKGEKHGFFNDKGDRKWHFLTLAATDRFLQSLGYLKGPATITTPSGGVLEQEKAAPTF